MTSWGTSEKIVTVSIKTNTMSNVFMANNTVAKEVVFNERSQELYLDLFLFRSTLSNGVLSEFPGFNSIKK